MDISLSVLPGTRMERDARDSDTCIPRRAWKPTEGRITSGLASPLGCVLEACQPSRATCPVEQ